MKKLLTASILCSIVFAFGCKNTSSDDPKTVLINFFDALSKKDIAGARKLATAESKSMLDMMEMGMKMAGGTSSTTDGKYDKDKVEFSEPKIEGDKATITVKEKTGGEITNFTLKKESGGWKVAFDKSSMMNMGLDKMKNKSSNNYTDSLNDKMKELDKINMDSLGDKMKESLEKLNKTNDNN